MRNSRFGFVLAALIVSWFGLAYASSAGGGTTNDASKLTKGTLGAARLPLATSSTVGAVKPGSHCSMVDGAGTMDCTTTGGTVNVTASTPDVVITPNPGTGTFTVGLTNPINAQVGTSYTVLATDMGGVVTRANSSAMSDTLPQAGTTGFASGVSTTVINLGPGTVTITPTISNIGGQSSVVLASGQSIYLISNGTNWIPFSGGGAAVSVTAGSPGIQITPTPGTGTFTVAQTNPVKLLSNTTTYTALAADMGTTLVHASATPVTTILAAGTVTGFGAGAGYVEMNEGTAALTVTATGGATINGAAMLVLQAGQAAALFNTSMNWDALIGLSTASGSPAFLNVAQSFTAAQRGTPVAATLTTSTFSEDFSAANHWTFALVHASCPCTIANPTNIVAGQSGVLAVSQSSTGSDTVSWGSVFKFASGAPILSTGASNVDDFSYYVRDATHVDVFTGGLNMH